MKKRLHLQRFFLFSLACFFSLAAYSQDDHDHDHDYPHDPFVNIGEIKNNIACITDATFPAEIIRKNVRFVFELPKTVEIEIDDIQLELVDGIGWFLYADLTVNGDAAFYRKKIMYKGGEFLIARVGEAEACLTTNCSDAEFVRVIEGCNCTQKINPNEPVDITHRLIFSAN